jgi:hypothetical protein
MGEEPPYRGDFLWKGIVQLSWFAEHGFFEAMRLSNYLLVRREEDRPHLLIFRMRGAAQLPHPTGFPGAPELSHPHGLAVLLVRV